MSKQKNNRPSEHKQFEAIITDLDEEQGIVKAIFAVMGNIDEGNDRIWPGSFTKTFNERGAKVLVLDNHKATSTMDTIAKPMSFRELSRAELPDEVLTKFPSATGGAEITAKFEPDGNKDAISAQAFYRLKNRWVTEWSFGYDALDFDYTTEQVGTKDVQVRNLRTLKLYEVSPVLWAMNSATMTTDAKAAEAKPWGIVPMGEQFCVFKLDENGEPADKLECYDDEGEANDYMQALYANVEDVEGKAVTRSEGDGDHPASHYLVVEDAQKPSTWHLRVRNVSGELDHRLMGAAWAALHGGYRGNVYEGPGKQEAIRKLTALYESEGLSTPGKDYRIDDENKAGRVLARRNAERIRKAYDALKEALEDAGLFEIVEEMEEETEKGNNGPPDNSQTPTSPGAGSQTEKSSVPDYLKLIEIERLKAEVR